MFFMTKDCAPKPRLYYLQVSRTGPLHCVVKRCACNTLKPMLALYSVPVMYGLGLKQGPYITVPFFYQSGPLDEKGHGGRNKNIKKKIFHFFKRNKMFFFLFFSHSACYQYKFCCRLSTWKFGLSIPLTSAGLSSSSGSENTLSAVNAAPSGTVSIELHNISIAKTVRSPEPSLSTL